MSFALGKKRLRANFARRPIIERRGAFPCAALFSSHLGHRTSGVDAPNPVVVSLLVEALHRRTGNAVGCCLICVPMAIRMVKRFAIDILRMKGQVIPNGRWESLVAGVWHGVYPRGPGWRVGFSSGTLHRARH
jgi:hypothetical protein